MEFRIFPRSNTCSLALAVVILASISLSNGLKCFYCNINEKGQTCEDFANATLHDRMENFAVDCPADKDEGCMTMKWRNMPLLGDFDERRCYSMTSSIEQTGVTLNKCMDMGDEETSQVICLCTGDLCNNGREEDMDGDDDSASSEEVSEKQKADDDSNESKSVEKDSREETIDNSGGSSLIGFSAVTVSFLSWLIILVTTAAL